MISQHENYSKVIVPSCPNIADFKDNNKMSVIDGGSFKCYQHDKLFETTDPEEWNDHITDGNHTESGNGPCAVCGKQTDFEHKLIGKKQLCDDCKEDLTK